MNHKKKVKIARKMMTREERKTKPRRTSIFQSEAWEERRLSKMTKK
jgi:hypothetical protein